MAYSVAKNTSFLTGASILQKIISFAYFTIVARVIGVNNTGAYFFALTFTSIFAVVADLGYSSVLTREMSKSPERAQSIFSTALTGKLIFGFFTCCLLILATNILGYSESTKTLIYLAGVTMFFDNIHTLFYAVFRAKRNLKFESFAIIGSQLITLIVGSIAMYLGWPLIWLIAAYAIPSALNVLYAGYFCIKLFALNLSLTFNRNAWREFLIMAWPFALAGIIGRLYSYSDSLIMSKILTERELGWWSVPYKITFAFQFIPIALSASVYPVFSSLFSSDKEGLAHLYEKSWRYLFTIVFPLAAGIFAISEPFIIKVYGAGYAPSILPLRILVFSLIFGYLAFISGALLNAIGEQKKQTSLMAFVLTVNVALNLILIPRLGITGAAISALIGNFILWLIGFIIVHRFAKIKCLNLIKYFIQTSIPSLLMCLVVYWMCRKMNFLVAIPAGAVIYALFLFITGGLSTDIIREIKIKLTGKTSYENINSNV